MVKKGLRIQKVGIDYNWLAKMGISIVVDGVDLVVGLLFGGFLGLLPVIGVLIGVIHDIINTVICYVLWGSVGFLHVLEAVCPFDSLDALIPTATISGIMARPEGIICKKIPAACDTGIKLFGK